MIFTKALPVSLLFLGLVSSPQPSFASSNSPLFPVPKADGRIDFYRLNPAHHDLGYEKIVDHRIATTLNNKDLPHSYYIPKNKLPTIRDQGERGTCAYFATLGLLETYYMAKSPTHSDLNLSEECLTDVRNWMFDQKTYTAPDKPGQRPDPEGDDPSSIVMTIQNNGVPIAMNYSSIYDCRYTDGDSNKSVSLDQYLETFTKSSATPSFAYGKGLSFDQNTAPTFDQIRALIANNIPVEIGITVYNEDFNNPDWDYDPQLDRDATLAGEHAVILTGYTGTRFQFRNSWGEGWGGQGYGTIEQRLIQHGWGYDKSLDFIISVHD